MTKRLPRLLLRALRLGAWTLVGLWALYLFGAFYYDLRLGLPAGISAILFAAIVLLIIGRLRSYRRVLALLGLCGLVTAYWLTLEPSNDRDWVPDKARLAHAEFDGDLVTIRDVRDARYLGISRSEPEYLDMQVDLSKVTGADLMLCFWGSEHIAHPMLSWRFEDGRPFTISIETRNRKDRGYSTVAGFYRQYELMYVVCTDRDAVLRRAIHEPEHDQVYLYKLNATPSEARRMLKSYLDSVNDLYENPRWYNTLTSNCMSNISIHVLASQDYPMPWNWAYVFPGRLDRALYKNGRLLTDIPFDELKTRGHLNERATAIGRVDDFWRQVRKGVPGFGDRQDK